MQLPQYSYDQDKLIALKQKIALSNAQMLELVYQETKFVSKLQYLNEEGYDSIEKQEYRQAALYFSQGEKLLEYAANCGKSIERNYIIVILNNEARLYQMLWQLDTSANYLDAIISSLTQCLQSYPQIQYNQQLYKMNTLQSQDFANSIQRKNVLVIYYLQFCAVNSQNKNHETAYKSTIEAIKILREICSELLKYQKNHPKPEFKYQTDLLKRFQVQTIINTNLDSIEDHYMETKHQVAQYLHNIKTPSISPEILQIFENYSLGTLMHVSLMHLNKEDIVKDINGQFNEISQIYRAIHISIAYFTMATQLRHVSVEKYPVNDAMCKDSADYQESQIYHMLSISTAARYLPCSSQYFTHIVNSFNNHYGIDILKQSEMYVLPSKINILVDQNSSSNGKTNINGIQQDSFIIHPDGNSKQFKKTTSKIKNNQHKKSNKQLKGIKTTLSKNKLKTQNHQSQGEGMRQSTGHLTNKKSKIASSHFKKTVIKNRSKVSSNTLRSPDDARSSSIDKLKGLRRQSKMTSGNSKPTGMSSRSSKNLSVTQVKKSGVNGYKIYSEYGMILRHSKPLLAAKKKIQNINKKPTIGTGAGTKLAVKPVSPRLKIIFNNVKSPKHQTKKPRFSKDKIIS